MKRLKIKNYANNALYTVLVAVLLWMAVSSMIQAFKCTDMTQTQLFLHIPKSLCAIGSIATNYYMYFILTTNYHQFLTLEFDSTRQVFTTNPIYVHPTLFIPANLHFKHHIRPIQMEACDRIRQMWVWQVVLHRRNSQKVSCKK